MYYAQILNGKVIAVTQTAEPVVQPDMIAIDGFSTWLLGYSYANGVFTPPQA